MNKSEKKRNDKDLTSETSLIDYLREDPSRIKRLIYEGVTYPNKTTLFIFLFCEVYNGVIDFLHRVWGSKKCFLSNLQEFNEILKRSLKRTQINDHLITLFVESLEINPKLIVELGVRHGESTFSLERVAKLSGSKLISVDVENCSHVSSYKDGIFVQSDDIEFAKIFKDWCKAQKISPEIDILFIDTSHLYEHTLQEINLWFPFLSKRSKAFFHDTNLKRIFVRKDKTMGLAWNNKRGVIRALEKYFNRKFNEKRDFVDLKDGWLIKHYSNCNGLLILTRIAVGEDMLTNGAAKGNNHNEKKFGVY